MRKRRYRRPGGKLPKGAYPLPNGNYVVTGSWGPLNERGRRFRVQAIHRAELDPKKIADALIAIALEQHRDQSER